MKKYFWLLLLIPSLCFGAAGDIETIGGKVDTAITSIAGKAGTAIATISGKNYTDGDAACADTSCTGFLVCQNFETATTGYDNSESWTESGTVEAAYTTTALRGTQSCQVSNSSYTRFNQGDQTEMYVAFRVAVTDGTPSATTTLLRFYDTAADAAKLDIAATSGVIQCQHGTVVTNTETTLSDATTYYMWVHYKGNSGATDGVLNLRVGSTRIYNDASEICNITNGDDASTNSDWISLTNSAAGGLVPIFDQVLVKTTAIGDLCE